MSVQKMRLTCSAEIVISFDTEDIQKPLVPILARLKVPALESTLHASFSVRSSVLSSVSEVTQLAKEALVAAMAAGSQGSEPGVSSPQESDLNELKLKYDRLVCSRLGILHD